MIFQNVTRNYLHKSVLRDFDISTALTGSLTQVPSSGFSLTPSGKNLSNSESSYIAKSPWHNRYYPLDREGTLGTMQNEVYIVKVSFESGNLKVLVAS